MHTRVAFTSLKMKMDCWDVRVRNCLGLRLNHKKKEEFFGLKCLEGTPPLPVVPWSTEVASFFNYTPKVSFLVHSVEEFED